MSHLFPTYTRFPFEIVKGIGAHLFDEQGNEYLDLTSGIGVCGLGYNVKALNDAVNISCIKFGTHPICMRARCRKAWRHSWAFIKTCWSVFPIPVPRPMKRH